MLNRIWASLIALSLLAAACQPAAAPAVTTNSAGQGPGPQGTTSVAPRVLAVESFLADIAQNVTGDRLKVEVLIPIGVDPHSFEPTPGDVRKIADSDVLIINGGGFEQWLQQTLENAGGQRLTIEAATGLTGRKPQEGEQIHELEGDPHFWLDPNLVRTYVENIREGLTQVDPQGAPEYAKNADAYITQLQDLDNWIAEQVKLVPEERRKIVTNHESLGYFADRYGFEIVGTIVPSVSTAASPSAQQLAQLVDRIRVSGAPAVFLETGTNPQLAEQMGRETGIKVITNLYRHSVTDAAGPAPTYLDMMRHNTQAIVSALQSPDQNSGEGTPTVQ